MRAPTDSLTRREAILLSFGEIEWCDANKRVSRVVYVWVLREMDLWCMIERERERDVIPFFFFVFIDVFH